MKRYGKELVVLICQLFLFYLFPLFAGPTDAMGMVVLIILGTLTLSLVLGAVSRSPFKWGYPALCAVLFLFYLFPLFAGPTDAMGMVVLIILGTLTLSLALGAVSRSPFKWGYPALCAVLFLPSVPMYYNFSALIHAVWYLVIAAGGLLLGSGAGALVQKLRKKAE